MPQIDLQYNDSINSLPEFNEPFAEIHFTIKSFAGIKIEICKSRVFQLDN